MAAFIVKIYTLLTKFGFNWIFKTITYKKGGSLFISAFPAVIITVAEDFWNMEFLGIQFTFWILSLVFIMTDFYLGATAYRKETGNKPGWFSDIGIETTLYKIFFLFLLFWLGSEIYNMAYTAHETSDSDFWKPIYGSSMSIIKITRALLFTLICSKEFISIGKNYEKKYGRKPYQFIIFEKIFDIVEFKFLRKIEGSTCPDNENIKSNESNTRKTK